MKQGDVISPILFNCALEVVFSRWKTKMQDQGWLLHTNAERLTNIRYADDILIFAKSRQEVQFMIQELMKDLQEVGLILHMDKSKVLTSSDTANHQEKDQWLKINNLYFQF